MSAVLMMPMLADAVASGIEYVGGKTAVFPGTTSTTNIPLTDLTGGLASAPAANDIVIVGYAVGSNGDQAIGVTTAGYTEEQELNSSGSRPCDLSVSWKIMSGSPDTSVDVSGTGSTNFAGAVAIQVWRGVNTTTPFDVAETTATGTASAQANPPSITPTTSGAVVLGIGGGSSDATGAVFTSSDLSNFITATSPDTVDAEIGMGSIAWTSGAVDPAQFGGATTAANDGWCAVTMALRPA